jgi:hypothetical protein
VWFGEWSTEPAAGPQDGADPSDSEDATPAPQAEIPVPVAPTAERASEPEPSQGAVETPAPAAAQSAANGAGVALDWSVRRRQAIDDLRTQSERAASYRSFSFPGTLAEEQAFAVANEQRRVEAGQAPARTAFDSPAKGRAGLSETTVLGERIVWVTDECYAKTGSNNLFLLPGAAGLFDVPMTTCVRVHPRDDLFDDVRPRYLMSADERADRAQRLGRDDNGAGPTFDD